MRKTITGLGVIVAAVAIFATGVWFPSSGIADAWRDRSQRQAAERFEEECEALEFASTETRINDIGGEGYRSPLPADVCVWWGIGAANDEWLDRADADERRFLRFCADTPEARLLDPWVFLDSPSRANDGVHWCVLYAPEGA